MSDRPDVPFLFFFPTMLNLRSQIKTRLSLQALKPSERCGFHPPEMLAWLHSALHIPCLDKFMPSKFEKDAHLRKNTNLHLADDSSFGHYLNGKSEVYEEYLIERDTIYHTLI